MSKFSTFPSHLLIRYSFNVYWPRPKVRILSLRPKKSERCFSKASQNSGLISLDWLFLPLTKDTYNGSSSRLSTETIRQTLKSTSHVLILKNDVIHNVHCYFVFFGIPVVILSIYRINVFFCLKNKLKIPNRPHTSNNCSELRKSYKQHGYLDKNNSRHTVNFLDVSRHTLNPIETLKVHLPVGH